MRTIRWTQFACAGVLAGCLAAWGPSAPEAALTLHIDTQHPGAEIPSDFAGLSFEMETLLPGKDGSRYFAESNKALIETFRNLGVRNLRIGGNTADRPSVPLPDAADVDSLFAFAKAAGARVIFTFRLRAGGPQDAAPIAKHMVDRYGSNLLCFAIGNEPDIYSKTYAAYRDELKRYMAAFAEAGAGAAKFCGPGTTPSKPEWARDFAEEFGHSGRILFVTQHAYPGASGREVQDGAAGRKAMLSPEWVDSYESFYRSFAPSAEKNAVPFRIEETNSYYHGGARDASDTFAAALWGLDYLHWWAMRGAAGINFHTGDQVAAADETTKCYYATFLTSARGYVMQPLAYAIRAFELGGHGRVVPVRLQSAAAGLNVRSYAVLSSGGDLYVTVINKEQGSGRNAMVTVVAGAPFRSAEILRLECGGGVSAKSGVTLGASAIRENGGWSGGWQRVIGNIRQGTATIGIPAASAAVLRFSMHAPSN